MATVEVEEEELGIDEMGSLFEGMVLFNPSQMEDDHHDDQNHRQPINPHPPVTHDTSSAASSSASLPLDENLFSDLTVITPIQTLVGLSLSQPQSDPSSPTTCTAATTTPSVSRQMSLSFTTRKKKRAGLRIGYGRGDTSSIPDDQPPPSPHAYDSPSLESYTTTIVEENDVSVSENTSEEAEGIASSHTSIYDGDGASQDNNSVSVSDTAAGATVLSKDLPEEEEDKQANTRSSPIELKFEQIRAEISEKLKHVLELVASVSAARKDSVRRRRKAAENASLASTKYRDLEKELEEACEAEDFETAERLSESLASADKEKERLAIALRDAEADCDAVDSKMQEVLELQIALEEECVSLLEIFAKDAANKADSILKNGEVMSSKEMDKWLSSTETIEVKKMELEIESHLINEARLVLNDSIEFSVEDDRRERELLCKRKEMLTEELEKLLALVKGKEAEIVENNSKIETVEKRIAAVVSSFQEVQSSIDTKYDNLQSGLTEMELETEALARKKKEIDDLLSQEEDRGAKLRELARISADEAKMYQEAVGIRKSLVLFILKSREDKVRLAKTEEKLSKDVQILRLEFSAARASLQELSSTKSSIQQEIESLKQRLLFIDKRVPELEAEKKVAAAARNFKEAARIASESKALSVEKEGVQIKMEGAILELGKLEEEICDTVNRLQEIESQISSKEKEVAVARFQRLLLIAGAATAERSAALELGDLEEADILLAEAEAAKSEARKLQPVHNLEEEFATLPKHFISMEFVSNLGGKQLAELAASAHISAL